MWSTEKDSSERKEEASGPRFVLQRLDTTHRVL